MKHFRLIVFCVALAATSLVVGLAIEGYEREVALDAVAIVVD